MNFREFQRIQARRSFLQQCAGGLGTIALWHLMDSEGRASDLGRSLPDINPLKPRAPHFTPKAKNVIFLFMEGGPSQLDLFDPKPALKQVRWPVSASFDDQGSETRLHQAGRQSLVQPSDIYTSRPVRHGDFRLSTSHGGPCR